MIKVPLGSIFNRKQEASRREGGKKGRIICLSLWLVSSMTYGANIASRFHSGIIEHL